jgi:hypothetical protein
MPTWQEKYASTVLVVSMTQLVFGAALGFIVGEGVLYSMKRFVGCLQRDEMRKRIRKLTPLRGSALIGGFNKYAGILGASAALITLGVWAVGDYLAARSAPSVARANAFDPSTAVLISDPRGSPDEVAGLTPATAVRVVNVEPYTDSDYKVHRRPHHAGAPLSLKETLVQRSEAKARADLLRQIQQHVHRSQYDCEATERASKYLDAGLDVWGFATWQLKYFPVESYKGATLPQCQDIKNVVDPSGLDLQSTIADDNHP